MYEWNILTELYEKMRPTHNTPTVSTSGDVEMNEIVGGEPNSDVGLAQETSQQKWQRVLALNTLRECGTTVAVDARLYRGFFLLFGEFYALSEKDDDAAIYNPFFYSSFALICLLIIADVSYVVTKKWQGEKINVNNTHVGLEFLETTLSIIGMVYFVREQQDKQDTLKSEIFILAMGFLFGFLQIVSDVKGEIFAGYGHGGHRLAFTKPSDKDEDQQVPLWEQVLNFILRISHFAQAITLLYSFMEVLEDLPLPTNYFVSYPMHAFNIALPIACLYALSNVLMVHCLRAEQVPSYANYVASLNSALQALTIGSLSYISLNFFTVTPQLYFDNQPNSLYIEEDPLRFYTTEVTVPLLGTLLAILSSVFDHRRNFNQRLESRMRFNLQEADHCATIDSLTHKPPATLIEQAYAAVKMLTERVTREVDTRPSTVQEIRDSVLNRLSIDNV